MSQYVSSGVRYVFSTNYGQELQKDVTKNVIGALDPTGGWINIIRELAASEGFAAETANPMFVANGHEGHSPKTSAYFLTKMGASVGGIVTGLDLGGIGSGLQTLNDGAVWYRINALFEQLVPPSRRAKAVEYTSWYSWEVARKAVTAGSLETQMLKVIRQKMLNTASGGLKTGITVGTGGWTGYFVNIGASAWGPKIYEWLGQDIPPLAQGLHWFAFLETVVGRGVGKGPALRILEIIWEHSALWRVAGADLNAIVREPNGWLVIADILQ